MGAVKADGISVGLRAWGGVVEQDATASPEKTKTEERNKAFMEGLTQIAAMAGFTPT
jgi:hypothetical protein